MTKAIQRALELESFGEAEDLKRSKAAVKSTMYEMEDGDERYDSAASDALTKIVDRRIIGELRRSLDFYISQPDGAAVDSLVLSGGHTALPYFANYVEEKLGIPVEIAGQPSEESAGLGDSVVNSDWTAFTVAVGLALQGVGAAPIEIDFLPEDIRVRREFKGKYKEVGVMVALLIAMIVLASSVGSRRSVEYGRIADEVQPGNVAAIEATLLDVEDSVGKRTYIKDKLDGLTKLIVQRDALLEFWSELLVEKPPELVFEKLEMSTTGKVVLWVSCKASKPILYFNANLEKRTDLISYLNWGVPVDNLKTPDGRDLYFFEMINPKKYERLRQTEQ